MESPILVLPIQEGISTRNNQKSFLLLERVEESIFSLGKNNMKRRKSMIYDKQPKLKKMEINLSGPQGNAFYLLGSAQNIARQLEFSEEKTESILKEMKSGDYENLIKVFDDNFGDFVDLFRK